MTAHYPTGHSLRKKIGDMGFDYWVRVYRNGDIWLGSVSHSSKESDALCMKLSDLGYHPKMKGKPATSGEFIIEI